MKLLLIQNWDWLLKQFPKRGMRLTYSKKCPDHHEPKMYRSISKIRLLKRCRWNKNYVLSLPCLETWTTMGNETLLNSDVLWILGPYSYWARKQNMLLKLVLDPSPLAAKLELELRRCDFFGESSSLHQYI